MAETSEISSAQAVDANNSLVTQKEEGMTRRSFLKALGAGAALLALKGSPLEAAADLSVTNEVQPSLEKETLAYQPALVIDVPPLADDLKQRQEGNRIDKETTPFDLDSFLEKHTGASLKQLNAVYGLEAEKDFPGEGQQGLTKVLLRHGKEREAVILGLAKQWSEHGLMVGNYAQMYRNRINKEAATPVVDWEEKLEGLSLPQYLEKYGLTYGQFAAKFPTPTPDPGIEAKFPLQPYEIFPLQDYVASITKSDRTDEFGNPYYDIVFDHQQLAVDLGEKLAQNPEQKVVNFSGNFRARLRLGYRLPENYLEDPNQPETFVRRAEGWVQDAYQSRPDSVGEDGLAIRSYPAVALETGYTDPQTLTALKEFCDLLPEGVTFVTAAGNSQADLAKITPADFEFPANCVMVAALEPVNGIYGQPDGRPIPAHLFYGNPDQLYYLQPIDINMSSFAAAHVAEWLVQQNVQNPQEAKRRLRQHSKVFKERQMRILDFGRTPIAHWDNPDLFE